MGHYLLIVRPMAHKQPPTRPDFHQTVELEMSRRGWGARTLARALAGEGASHERIETERKVVRRWLGGAQPSPANKSRVAVALGLPEDTFDDAEEEDSLAAFLQREVGRAAQRATRQWEQRQRERESVSA